MSKLLSIDEVAQALSVSRRTVYSLLEQGRIGAIKIGRSTRIAADELARFVASLPMR